MYVLGLNLSHNSTACLLKDGIVLGCVSEERFVRIKNFTGFPVQSVKYLLSMAEITADDLDFVVHGGASLILQWDPISESVHPVKRYLFSLYTVLSYAPPVEHIVRAAFNLFMKRRSRRAIYSSIGQNLKVPRNKIVLAPHHECHAYAAFYGLIPVEAKSEFLVVTHDGEGDDLCGLVMKSKEGKLESLLAIPSGNSLAAFYALVTLLLGMKINEHEYKVMGLAPYASFYDIKRVLPIFLNLSKVNGIKMHSRFSIRASYSYLKRALFAKRFDAIAGAVQQLIEIRLVEWLENVMKQYPVNNLVLGGGLFMNVKLNKIIGEMPSVESIAICPSAGDESNALGAAYWGFVQRSAISLNNLCTLHNLYLGPSYSNEEVYSAIRNLKNCAVQKVDDIEKCVARLLADGEVVARFRGRSEWGARALRNRSILADPRRADVVRVINTLIKGRDFWMPFSPTILFERAAKYIENPKQIDSSFMMIGFDTTELGKEVLKAAMHPYDFTVRPQLLRRQQNELYYDLLLEFEKITGVGAVVNTSFNLHGEPIVLSPADAVHTFINSDLKYLAIEDYLVSKAA